jgi:hypothetical protein
MADITNPEAVKFCNEKIRPAANLLAKAYFYAIQTVDEWYANNMGELLPVAEDIVVDGSESDGRHPISGNDVNNLVTRLSELIQDLEENSKAKLNTILKVSTLEN